MNDVLLQFIEVSKHFMSGDTQLIILEKINFSLSRGTSVAITGKSGSGKSTFLHLAGSLDSPSEGVVRFGNKDLHALDDRALSAIRNKHIGFIFQSHILLDDFTALENVCIPALMCGNKRKDVDARARQLLHTVDLTERLHHRPNKLSGGERQRVAMCRALINNPDLIIADEPTGSLDEESSEGIEDLLLTLVRQEGKSLLLVTHDYHLAQKCSQVFLLRNRELEEIR